MVDDSFEYGNDTTFVLPSKLTSSSNPAVVDPQAKKREPIHAKPWSSREDDTKYSDHSVRRQILRNLELERERDWLRNINQLLLKSADEMDKIKHKFENVQSATQTSHDLLDLYSKILGQTEHTKDLLSNPDWKGLTEDIQVRSKIEEQERINLLREKEKEEAEELERQTKQRQVELEEAQKIKQQNQLTKSTRSGSSSIPTKNSRDRGRGSGVSGGSTAGRTVRGKSRIGRITR